MTHTNSNGWGCRCTLPGIAGQSDRVAENYAEDPGAMLLASRLGLKFNESQSRDEQQ